MNKIILGDCLTELKLLPENSVDSIVTDPPYELGFMGKSWDNTGIANNPLMWKECLRVLKPGGYLLSFGGTRTYHRMASAIEDAGFEVRDMIEWCYGSGFPKSLNVADTIAKREGAKREGAGTNGNTFPLEHNYREYTQTENSKQWSGWGTALKPAHEPICLARKPLAEKTVAENVLKYGTGGINIDESRVGIDDSRSRDNSKCKPDLFFSGKQRINQVINNSGRFPANLIHDGSEEVRECFPETKSGAMNSIAKCNQYNTYGKMYERQVTNEASEGNASRFFKSIIYQAKASKSERNKGCEDMDKQITSDGREKSIDNAFQRGETLRHNNHPTVKPIALMEYLIKMVTPKGGIVLDPFAGSGSTLVAAKQNGFEYIGIEITEEYIPIIEARLQEVKNKQQNLF